MGKSSLHAVRWSEEHQCYELLMAGRHLQIFGQEEISLWHSWLAQQTSFAFQGQHGHISVLKENRKRGAGYWYAYMTHNRHTRKRYLGTLTEVTFERLEKIA